ncbi:HAD-IA family hydrolase [Rhodoluna sp.]|uniref:HAD-IA family hydrolase n=1 Tax=Rhodoluna sp. TaxID=1969481 RepID=UPI0025E5302B|nr:HAD-IA family hydrolase [Rhodoluna sp.]
MKFSASGLLFDNDGVLVDSHEAAKDAWAIWCSEYAPHINWDSAENAGVRAEDKVRLWVAPELFEEANNRINQLEQDTAHETVPLGGAVELLHSLKPGTWTVCTSANPNLGRARLEAAGLPVPAELVTAADVQNGKPNPDPYLLGAKRLGFEPADCVVFEDAEAGVIAAIEAGVGLVIGVSKRAMKTQADIVVKDLSGITFDGDTLVIPDKNRLR